MFSRKESIRKQIKWISIFLLNVSIPYLFFCQQPTFEDGEIELARTEVLAQDPMVDNKHALAVSLARSEMLVQDPMTDHKQALAMSLARSEIFVQDPMASEHKHPLAVSLSLGNTLINLNKIKCPQCRKVRILCSRQPTTNPSLASFASSQSFYLNVV